MSRIGPTRAAVRSTQRDEMAHTTGAVQLLNVVPPDQAALRVPHEIDTLPPVFASELFDAVDAMRAVSQPTESTRQRADDAPGSEEAMHWEHRSLTAVRR
jgi:hypothetical protein